MSHWSSHPTVVTSLRLHELLLDVLLEQFWERMLYDKYGIQTAFQHCICTSNADLVLFCTCTFVGSWDISIYRLRFLQLKENTRQSSFPEGTVVTFHTTHSFKLRIRNYWKWVRQAEIDRTDVNTSAVKKRQRLKFYNLKWDKQKNFSASENCCRKLRTVTNVRL